MEVVDTNVLLDAANSRSQYHAACRERLERLRRESSAWYSTWGILYEFLRVMTHPRVLDEPWSSREAWRFVEAILAAPGFSLLTESERHAVVAAEVFGEMPALFGNILHDAHTAILMREHGVRRICTRDSDFHRFSFLEVLDPTA